LFIHFFANAFLANQTFYCVFGGGQFHLMLTFFRVCHESASSENDRRYFAFVLIFGIWCVILEVVRKAEFMMKKAMNWRSSGSSEPSAGHV